MPGACIREDNSLPLIEGWFPRRACIVARIIVDYEARGPGFESHRNSCGCSKEKTNSTNWSAIHTCLTRALIFQHHGICSCLVLAPGGTAKTKPTLYLSVVFRRQKFCQINRQLEFKTGTGNCL